MARYRRVDVKLWTDRFFTRLTDSQKLVWVYLISSPQTTPCGIYVLSRDRAAHDLGWTLELFLEQFRELLSKASESTLRWDESTLVLWLPRWLKYNPPINPNAIKSWVPIIEGLPEDCPLISEWYLIAEQTLYQYRESMLLQFQHLFAEQKAEPSCNRIQDTGNRIQDQEEEGYSPHIQSAGSGQGHGKATPKAIIDRKEKLADGPLAGRVRYTGRGDLAFDWLEGCLVPQVARNQLRDALAARYPEIDMEAKFRDVERWLRQNPGRGRERLALAKWIENRWAKKDSEGARARTGKGRGRVRTGAPPQVDGPSTGNWDGLEK